MAALGRILQIVGWLWLIGGFLGSLFGFVTFSLLPGIILVFVARVIRNQTDRTEMPELGDQRSEERSPPDRRQTGETERPRPSPAPAPSPEPYVPEMSPRSEPTPGPEAKSSPRPRDIFENLAAGSEKEEHSEPTGAMPTRGAPGADRERPLSSAEMIARAHQRWDSKKRR